MLTIYGGQSARFCDGISRRGFLKIGAFAFGATTLTLADLLRAEAKAGGSRHHKAVINIFLGGGPPHQDMWEIKTEAPAEIRGEFKPIATNVPGIQIGEVFPRIAAAMDKCVVIRSVVGAGGGHDAFQCMTGWPHAIAGADGRPAEHRRRRCSKLQGPVDPSVPPFVGLADKTQHMPWSDSRQAGLPRRRLRRLQARRPGHGQHEAQRHHARTTAAIAASCCRASTTCAATSMPPAPMTGMDAFGERAFGRADLEQAARCARPLEGRPPSVRERYGDGKPYKFQYDGAPTVNDHLLMARRLVEAGVALRDA